MLLLDRHDDIEGRTVAYIPQKPVTGRIVDEYEHWNT